MYLGVAQGHLCHAMMMMVHEPVGPVFGSQFSPRSLVLPSFGCGKFN